MNKKELFIGVMSGTSLDGVDIALCEIDATSCRLVHSQEYSFTLDFKESILNAISSSITLQELGQLDHNLGLLYADSINQFLLTYKIDPKDVNAIGLHGQTLWHEPDSKTPFTMQLGDANIVAAQTQIKTVADFRRMDIANGGQGAPFAPAFHHFLFSSLEDNVAVVNIGGMANITLLGETLEGWDSGCGNVLLDMWVEQTEGTSYDKDGEFARSGTLNAELLKIMLQDKYFSKPPPKSTGREHFNQKWLENALDIYNSKISSVNLRNADIQRTLLELTASTIVQDIKIKSIDRLIVCGGGAKNIFLMQRLQELSCAKVQTSDTLGVSSDFLEAMAFAWLAYKRINEEVVALSSVTGAKKDSLLGGIYG